MEFGYLSGWKSHLRLHINLDAARACAKFLICQKDERENCQGINL
jgi:hypothetical protein